VDVDVTNGGSVKDNGASVARVEPVDLILVLREGLGPEVVEEFVIGVGPFDEIRKLAQLNFRDIGKEGSIRAVDPGEIGEALEDRPGIAVSLTRRRRGRQAVIVSGLPGNFASSTASAAV